MKWEMDLPSSGATLYSSGTVWTLQQNKIFENALAKYDKDTPDRWEKVAAMLPGKNATEVRRHYEVLEEDVRVIEAGLVDLPSYSSSTYMLESGELDRLKQSFGSGGKGSSTKSSEQERKKGVPWTEEEHRLFLMGLNKYGKGDWRSISRNFVVSRTPTQVASHAQKYFIRLSSGNKDKRRSSIHDITSVNTTDRRQVPSQHASVGSSSIPATISQPPPLMYSSNAMGRTSLMNSLGSPAGDKPIMLSPYSLGLYAYRGLGSHSHSTIIPDSCLAVPHIEYCTHPTMRH